MALTTLHVRSIEAVTQHAAPPVTHIALRRAPRRFTGHKVVVYIMDPDEPLTQGRVHA